MKHYVIIVGLLAISLSSLKAQTTKGSIALGGSFDGGLSTNYDPAGFHFSLNPSAGYFVKNNWLVGGEMMGRYFSQPSYRSSAFELGVFSRYYLGSGQFRPFLQAGTGYLFNHRKFRETNASERGKSIYARVGGGLSVFITKQVALDLSLDYNMGSTLYGYQSSRLGARIGVRIFF